MRSKPLCEDRTRKTKAPAAFFIAKSSYETFLRIHPPPSFMFLPHCFRPVRSIITRTQNLLPNLYIPQNRACSALKTSSSFKGEPIPVEVFTIQGTPPHPHPAQSNTLSSLLAIASERDYTNPGAEKTPAAQ